ncbi:hypothetical protein LCGC14_2253400 [marine sediment metagenome]|uniref:Uncharacterized protein n=1 Tax=marine sediment metagenome TaxID=412755 RepID=A0A0F9D261_9ZZZZ
MITKLKAFLQRLAESDDPQKAFIEDLITHVEEPTDRELYEVILKNQFNYISSYSLQKCPHCGEDIDPLAKVHKLLPKLVVKVLDELIILREFVGIQPLQGPVGQIFKLRCKKLEDSKRMSLEVLLHVVEAKSRKLHARFTMEAAQDLKTQHGVDIEDEFLQALASETAHDIIAEILQDIQTKVKRVEFANGDQLGLHIQGAANDIAKKTRRGAGNFVILSIHSLALLRVTESSTFVPMTDEEKSKYSSKSFLQYVGILNGTIKVFVDPFFEGDAIVGYKGGTGETDCGLVYSPYVMIMSTGVVMDSLTFQPVVGFLTRYGKTMDDAAKSYYITLKQKGKKIDLIEAIQGIEP